MNATIGLTAEHVEAVLIDCLFKDGEDTTNRVAVEGLVRTFGFHPARLEAHRQEIADMLAMLSDDFRTSEGACCMRACWNRDGRQWTGYHMYMEQLVCLGIATGQVEYVRPRDQWYTFPGGMPYIMVKQ